MAKKIELIGEIDFRDIKVQVYHGPYSNGDDVQCAWRMRNPDSSYTGIIHMDSVTGKMSYPDEAVVPVQTDRDREMLPQFVITGIKVIDDKFITSLGLYLDKSYKIRNGKRSV